MITSLMVARDRNSAIGKDNKLPWHLTDDLKLFKRNTLNHSILMGRKTYESIGNVLPKRTNIILTRSENYKVEGAKVINSIEDVYKYCESIKCEQLFIIGGGSVFKNFVSLAQYLYITEVDTEIEDADIFFPSVDLDNYNRLFSQPFKKGEKNEYNFTFNLYCKK